MKVILGSQSPIKLKALESALKEVFPNENPEIIGLKVISSVSSQPMSDIETIKGAMNRINECQKVDSSADYYFGLEGGIQQIDDYYFDKGWVVVMNNGGKVAIASSPNILIPDDVMKLVHEGKELSIAVDQIYKQQNTKLNKGVFDALSKGLTNDQEIYKIAVVLALSQLI